jgi:hypothetical protein
MITYSWKIDTVKTINEGPFRNAVAQVYWTKTAITKDNKTGIFKGCTSFSIKEILLENFVDIKDVNEEMIIEWVKSSLTDSNHNHINSVIELQISS